MICKSNEKFYGNCDIHSWKSSDCTHLIYIKLLSTSRCKYFYFKLRYSKGTRTPTISWTKGGVIRSLILVLRKCYWKLVICRRKFQRISMKLYSDCSRNVNNIVRKQMNLVIDLWSELLFCYIIQSFWMFSKAHFVQSAFMAAVRKRWKTIGR